MNCWQHSTSPTLETIDVTFPSFCNPVTSADCVELLQGECRAIYRCQWLLQMDCRSEKWCHENKIDRRRKAHLKVFATGMCRLSGGSGRAEYVGSEKTPPLGVLSTQRNL